MGEASPYDFHTTRIHVDKGFTLDVSKLRETATQNCFDECINEGQATEAEVSRFFDDAKTYLRDYPAFREAETLLIQSILV